MVGKRKSRWNGTIDLTSSCVRMTTTNTQDLSFTNILDPMSFRASTLTFMAIRFSAASHRPKREEATITTLPLTANDMDCMSKICMISETQPGWGRRTRKGSGRSPITESKIPTKLIT